MTPGVYGDAIDERLSSCQHILSSEIVGKYFLHIFIKLYKLHSQQQTELYKLHSQLQTELYKLHSQLQTELYKLHSQLQTD